MEGLNGAEDFIFNEAVSFAKVFAYQLNSNACKLLATSKDGKPTVFESIKKDPATGDDILGCAVHVMGAAEDGGDSEDILDDDVCED